VVARLRSGLVALALLAGCLSPTLPLPPPSAPLNIAKAQEAGHWQLRGTCADGATVLVKNEATTRITGVEDSDGDGRYFITVEAKECDRAEVWQIVGTEVSIATSFVIEPTLNGVPTGSTCP
jgi:hypothetical protein